MSTYPTFRVIENRFIESGTHVKYRENAGTLKSLRVIRVFESSRLDLPKVHCICTLITYLDPDCSPKAQVTFLAQLFELQLKLRLCRPVLSGVRPFVH